MSNPILEDEIKADLDDIRASIQSCRELGSKIKGAELSISNDEQAYRAEILKCESKLAALLTTPNLSDEHRLEAEELSAGLAYIRRMRPAVLPPLLLRLSMGSASVIQLDPRSRLRYKSEYEDFKVTGTLLVFIISVLQLMLQMYDLGFVAIDYVINFLLLYMYSTITLREQILIVNGSRIRSWWVIHHLICVALTGTLLVWPPSPAYLRSRTLTIVFNIYISGLQYLQYRYQKSRLYVLRSLSRIGPMQTTTESAQVHVRNSLAFLMPFLVIGFVRNHPFLDLPNLHGVVVSRIGS